ncbi:hypothetical protein M758_UG067400 [Ceratodon purpureus]|nr:hypothetical protein M758_UG067400 [Ceratodon purpureus]
MEQGIVGYGTCLGGSAIPKESTWLLDAHINVHDEPPSSACHMLARLIAPCSPIVGQVASVLPSIRVP